MTFGLKSFLDAVSKAKTQQGELLTLRYKIPVLIPRIKKALATKFGRANGNLIKNLFLPKSLGILSAGFAKKPPKDGPKIEPRLHTSGIIENALG